MAVMRQIEAALRGAVEVGGSGSCPPRLREALEYAVFPGGARVRPRLCLAVARACGGDRLDLALAAGTAIELLHCASLVHDDLPCFDDAPTRRGKPALHRAFDEPLAVLAGDGLIVLAFETLARAGAAAPGRLAPLLTIVAEAVGAARGIVGGQAWESEPVAPLRDYQLAKTGALFIAAASSGAVASGAVAASWRGVGECLGEAYQVADDVRDVVASADEVGKPTGQDAMHGRPNAARELGVEGAVRRLKFLVAGAIDAIPPCDGADDLRALIWGEADRLLPRRYAAEAA